MQWYVFNRVRKTVSQFPGDNGQLKYGLFSSMGLARVLYSILLCSLFLCLAIFPGCEESDVSRIDSRGEPPNVRILTLSIDSVNIDSLVPVNGVYTVPVTIETEVDDSDGLADVSSVSIMVFRPGATSHFIAGNLAPSATPGHFSADIAITLTRSQIGQYKIQVEAIDKSGLTSNALSRTVTLLKNNTPPALSGATLRGTTPAGSDSTFFTLSVIVADSDGIGDVAFVSVRALNSTDSSQRTLYDDGLPVHGDLFPGDGVFSGTAWVTPTIALPNVEFEFVATDRRGGVSDPLRRAVLNEAPAIVRVVVPDSIQRPSSGSRLIVFQCEVTDPDGLGDIDSVFFRNVTSENPANISMFDDGNIPVNGDTTANDGIYSRIVSIDASVTLGIREFRFYVVDRVAARDSLIRFITIY